MGLLVAENSRGLSWIDNELTGFVNYRRHRRRLLKCRTWKVRFFRFSPPPEFTSPHSFGMGGLEPSSTATVPRGEGKEGSLPGFLITEN